MDSTRKTWMEAQVRFLSPFLTLQSIWQVMYTYPKEHTLILEAIPKPETTQVRRYRGYIAVDEIKFRPGSACKGHCTFDSGFCKFANDPTANFQWMVGRGSENPNTGPQRDHSSFATNRVTGAFAYIDAGHPRRPGDKAQLLSEEFPATDKSELGPLCLRFWTHMYGNGVGSLNVYVKGASSGDVKIWGLTGDAGNNWYMGQAPIASTEPFRIVFEGVVGRNSLGNIAIDDISIAPGVCPTAPQVAATGPGDCSFEDDECGWSNPEKRDKVDELDWERMAASEGSRYPLTDHTTGSQDGFFMQVSRDSIQRAGDRAFLVSREMEGTNKPRCVSFWYYMYEPIVDTTGPNLGKLAIWTRTIDRQDRLVMTPVWRLHNGRGPSWQYGQAQVTTDTTFQVIIEGVWGNNRASGFLAVDDVTFYDGLCATVPEQAVIVKGECTFDRDSCGWKNTTTVRITPIWLYVFLYLLYHFSYVMHPFFCVSILWCPVHLSYILCPVFLCVISCVLLYNFSFLLFPVVYLLCTISCVLFPVSCPLYHVTCFLSPLCNLLVMYSISYILFPITCPLTDVSETHMSCPLFNNPSALCLVTFFYVLSLVSCLLSSISCVLHHIPRFLALVHFFLYLVFSVIFFGFILHFLSPYTISPVSCPI